MRPIRITIEGLRSFRSGIEIDFADRTHIAVVGDTGAGKSSILQAMTYALYGQTSLGGRSKQELMNDVSDMMRVVLRFRVSGEEWEVARVDKRSGTGLGPPKAQLVRYGPENEPIEKVEQVRPVNDRIQELIGLDSNAFLRTVILPQGRFARLLVEDRPADRTDILRQVWPTWELEDAGAAAGRWLADAKALRVRLEDEAARHPEDPKAHLERLSAAAKGAAERAKALAGLRDRAWKASESLRAAEAVIRAAKGVAEGVDPAVMDRLRDRLAPVEAEQHRIDAGRAEMEAAEAGLNRELKSIPSDDGAGLREVARALAALEAISGEAEGVVQRAEGMRSADGELGEARDTAKEAKGALDEATERLANHREDKAPLTDAVESAKKERERANKLHDRCEELGNRLEQARNDLTARRDELVAIAPRLEAARNKEQGARREAERAEVEVTEAQRANAAAAAAHDLCPGNECPVCERELPEGWTPPPDEGLEKARNRRDAARSRLRDAREMVAAVKGQEVAAERSVEYLEGQRSGLRSELGRMLEQLGEAAGPSTIAARLRDAESRLAAHNDATEQLRDAHTAATVAAGTAEVALRNASRESARATASATDALNALRRNVRSIPPPFRPQLALPANPAELKAIDAAPVDRARYAAGERQEILKMREAKRQRIREEIDDLRGKLADLESTRKTTVEQPLGAILDELHTHCAAVADAVRNEAIRSDFAERITLPPALYQPDPAAIGQSIDTLRRAMTQALELAANLRRRAAQSAAAARGEARQIADELGWWGVMSPHPLAAWNSAPDLDSRADPSDLGSVFLAADKLATDARYAARDAERARNSFAATLDDLLELHRTAAEAADLERALGDLDAALKPGAFLKWLTLRRSRELLVAASRMLNEITGGRYSFADPGDRDDQQWLVLDNDSGQGRTPASLSGGEQFIGSLSLALGMVEMMARSGGRLESLFLDEGFGSLDRGNLDAAIEALGTVAGRGRMVGVISHVGAVAEQIDHVLAVTRTATGSRATWLSRAERRDLAQSDAGLEGASALAGLLD